MSFCRSGKLTDRSLSSRTALHRNWHSMILSMLRNIYLNSATRHTDHLLVLTLTISSLPPFRILQYALNRTIDLFSTMVVSSPNIYYPLGSRHVSVHEYACGNVRSWRVAVEHKLHGAASGIYFFIATGPVDDDYLCYNIKSVARGTEVGTCVYFA